MSSGGALTMTTIVYENVGSTMRPSPTITRCRSDGVAPHRLIHRRIGNQYSTASVRITKKVGIMMISFQLMQWQLRHRALRDRTAIVRSCLLQEIEHSRIHHSMLAEAHIVLDRGTSSP